MTIVAELVHLSGGVFVVASYNPQNVEHAITIIVSGME